MFPDVIWRAGGMALVVAVGRLRRGLAELPSLWRGYASGADFGRIISLSGPWQYSRMYAPQTLLLAVPFRGRW